METHTSSPLRAYRRSAHRRRPARPAPFARFGAALLSVALCAGLMPVIPAWADETTAAPVVPAETAPPAAATGPGTDVGAGTDAAAPSDPADAPDKTAPAEAHDPTAAGEKATTDPAVPTNPAAPAVPPAVSPAPEDPAAADPAAAGSDETTALDDPEETAVEGKTVDQYFPTDKEAAAKLLKKLTARFSTDGDDGKLSADTVNAALALNALGKGADIDADGLVKRLLKDEKAGGSLTLGQYGRYIMALTAAGIDCAKAQIGGKTRNLVVEMEKLTETTEPTAEEAVYLLPVYGNDNYRNINGMTPEELIELILAAQDDEGFFWADEKAESYSMPLTSRAVLALVPYLDDELVDKKLSDEVAAAVDAASEALYDAQLIDGSWPAHGLALEGDVPATAYATTALVALGANPEKDLKTSNDSTPLGYLTAHADKALDGYTAADGVAKSDEPATSATVLMALAANKGYAKTKDAFDVYDVRAVKRPTTTATATKTTTTPVRTTPMSNYRSPTAAKTIPQSGDELPWTIGLTGAAAAFSLAAALLARRQLRQL